MTSAGACDMGDTGPLHRLAEEAGGGQAAPHSEDPSRRPGRRNKQQLQQAVLSQINVLVAEIPVPVC